MPKIEIRGRSFFFEEAGSGGDPLVFLSGLGGDHRAYNRPQRYFAGKYRAMAFDSRDAGQSDRAEQAYTTADMADDVAGWLDATKATPAHVVGQSLGGLVAQELALRHPQMVKSLVLVSTHAGSEAWRRAVMASWVLLRRRLDIADFTRAVLPWLVAPPFYRQPGQVEGVIQFAERNPWPRMPTPLPGRRPRPSSTNRETGSLISAAPLVLVGELDLLNPPHVAAELAERIPQRSDVGDTGGGSHAPRRGSVAFRLEIERFLEHSDA